MHTIIENIQKQLEMLDNSSKSSQKSKAKVAKATKELIKLFKDAHELKDDNLWQTARTFLYRTQSVLDDKGREGFFHAIASLNALEFTIYLLSPYIYEKTRISLSDSDGDLISSSIKTALEEGCQQTKRNRPGDEKKLIVDLIDELEHLVAHYAKEKYGNQIADWIVNGITNALPNKNELTFDDVTNVRQAYCNKQQSKDADIHRVHRTIRINDLPFAEGVFIYLMTQYAHEYGINLKVERIPWQDVGAALLTNRIDVAVHNETLKTKQLVGLHRIANNRILYHTDNIFQYKKYYLLGRKSVPNTNSLHIKITGNNKSRVAVVLNSDHENVFRHWWEEKSKKNRKIKKGAEDVWLPVSTPDAAVAAVVDGKADYCFAGGIHKEYSLREFRKIFTTSNKEHSLTLKDNIDINISFWSVSSRKTDSKILLNDIVTLWTEVFNQWNSVKHSEDQSVKELQKSCVAYVNGRPNKAFVKDFKELQKLIDEHDTFLPFDSGKIEEEQVRGW